MRRFGFNPALGHAQHNIHGARRITTHARWLNGGARLRAIKTKKQVPYGVPHSQREPAPPPVLVTVVKHMAALAQGLQISQPVIGGIMVEVGSSQDDPGRAKRDVVANSSSKAASASIAPRPLVFIPPSSVA